MASEGNHLEEDEIVGVHDLLAEHHRQELVEGDVLDQGRVDVASLLERSMFMALPRIYVVRTFLLAPTPLDIFPHFHIH